MATPLRAGVYALESACSSQASNPAFLSVDNTSKKPVICKEVSTLASVGWFMQHNLERQNKVALALGQHGMDALVCASASDVLLLSGYWPVMASTIAVSARPGQVFLIVPEDEADLAAKTSSATLLPYKPGTLEKLQDITASVRSCLVDVFHQLHLQHGVIGIRREVSVQPATYIVGTTFHHSLFHLLFELLPLAEIRAADALLEREKAVKTAPELETMRRAAHLAAAGFAVAQQAIQPGLREAEVASAIQSAFDRSPEAQAIERSYGCFFCMSGPNSASASAAYARTRQRTIEPGDLVMIHANTCADGYWTDITRTYTAGIPSDRHAALRAAVMQARAAALQAIRPGVAASAVDAAARSVMKKHGYGDAFRHATGHGVGYAAANGNALPRIHPRSPDILEAAMTFNIEPAAYFDGYGGMRHCDVVAVTHNAATVLTDF